MKKKYYLWLIVTAVIFASCDNYQLSEPGDVDDNDSIPALPLDSINDEEPDNRTPDQKRDLAYLFDLNAIPEITISLTEEQWNQYLQNFDDDMNNSKYVTASFSFTKDGVTYVRDSVGLRPRGNTSRRRPEGQTGEKHNKTNADWHHAHFGVKFTEYESGERFFGMDRIVLKWFKDDPSYCREIFCYDLFHRFGVWSAPRASYCRLTIHIIGDNKPAYFGVYEMIEGVRKGWKADRRKEGLLPDNDGNLWKAAWGANLSEANASLMGVSDDNFTYTYSLKSNKTNGLAAAQQELCNFINGMTPLKSGSTELQNWLEQNMDVDLFLRAYAVNVMVGMWDDYWINQNNYYFYFDLNHKFYFIPYDYDNTLGTSSIINAGTQDMLHWGSLEGDRMLMRKVMSVNEYKERYKSYIKELATNSEYMEPTAAQARVRKFQQFVQKYVSNDTNEDMTIEDKPASWSNVDYRMLSGNSNGENGSNYFTTKVGSISW